MEMPLRRDESAQDEAARSIPRLSIDDIIRTHGLAGDAEALKEISAYVQHRRVVVDRNVDVDFDDQTAHFLIKYDNGEQIEGHLIGIRRDELRPLVIWSPPFGMTWDAGMRRLYLTRARLGTPAVAACYDAAGRPRHTTFSRFYQDMQEVVSFLAGQPFVDDQRLGLVGISYTCNIALKIAAEDHRVASVFCLLPSFDVVCALNKFRQQSHGVNDAIERFARAEPGWQYLDWRTTDKCEYFGIRAKPVHLVDMLIHPEPDSLRAEGFLAFLRTAAARGVHVRFALADDDCLVNREDIRLVLDGFRLEHSSLAGFIADLDFRGGRKWHTHKATKKARSYNAFGPPNELRRVARWAWDGFRSDLCGGTPSRRGDEVPEQTGRATPLTVVEAEFERILRTAPVGIVVTSTDGQLIYANDGFYDLMGYDATSPDDRAALDARDIASLYKHPEDRDRLIAILKEFGQVEDFRVRGVDRLGDTFWASINCRFVSFRNEHRLETTVRDITDIIHAERAAADFKRRAIEEARNRDEFLDRVSHDLTGPAKRLEGLLGLVERDGGIDRYRAALRSNIHLIRRLTTNLLEFSRINAGRMNLNPVHLTRRDVVDMLEEFKTAYQMVLDEESKRLDIDVAGDCPDLYIDETKLEAVLLNLIDNALKFAPKGKGRVRVTVAPQSDESVVFEVHDNGPGIAEADHKRIFGKYEQAVHISGGPGFGIGLFIARRYAERLDGQLTVDSKHDGPTTFSLELPRRSRGRPQASRKEWRP